MIYENMTINRLEAQVKRLEAELEAANDEIAEARKTREVVESRLREIVKALDLRVDSLLAEAKRYAAERDKAARNERLRIADRAEALAMDHREAGDNGHAAALEALAAELRAEGGGT